MDLIYQSILYLHIAAGFFSLVIFWIPILTKKGRKAHRVWGRWYVRGMAVVVSTALLLSILLAFKQDFGRALFLALLSFLSGQATWAGYTVLNHKKERSERYRKIDFTFNSILFVLAIGLIILFFTYLQISVFLIFGIIGLIAGFQGINQYRKGMQQHWLLVHLSSLLFSGAAAYTAFFAFGAYQFLSTIITGGWIVLPWILPTVITTIVVEYLKRKVYKFQTPKIA